MKKTFKDISVTGKRVLLRVDFNVPLDEQGKIINDARIRAELPTISYLLRQNAKIIIVSHLGRPNGMFNPKYSLAPVAKRLSEILSHDVKLATDVVGDGAQALTSNMQNGDIVMLENVRFHKEEEENDEAFCKKLASLADVFVNDAFGSAHRAHASTAGVARYLPAVAGFLMSKEITAMQKVLQAPEQPFVVILGGAKVSDKIGVVVHLLDKANVVLIGGAMANTFIVAKGGNVGLSRYEQEKVEVAKKILEKAEQKNVKVVLPIDEVVATEFSPTAKSKVVDAYNVPANYQGMDIGPKTRKAFKKEIKRQQIEVDELKDIYHMLMEDKQKAQKQKNP